MSVLARDAVASDHLVYAWPFPIGPEEHEVACAEDEQVVMCPAWVVGGLFGPGRHRWRTPDPMSPSAAYFVLTAPVEVEFDLATTFQLPATGETVRVRATGSLHVRCSDPGLLIAQFVGLPFDAVNEGILRSVSRSVERMLARLLTRRVVIAATPAAITDPAMLSNIVEELVAYNPAAGAVFGVELMRMGHVAISADDGTLPWDRVVNPDWSGPRPRVAGPATDTDRTKPPAISMTETLRAPPPPARGPTQPTIQPMDAMPRATTQPPAAASGEIAVRPRATSAPAEQPPRAATPSRPPLTMPAVPPPPGSSTTVEPPPGAPTPRMMPAPMPPMPEPRRAKPIEIPQTDEPTHPNVQVTHTPVPGTMRIGVEPDDETRGAILGIGVGHIGSAHLAGLASGEIANKVAPGARVLVPGPDGLMQSATVRQLLQGYYELEVGGSGETIWVPVTGVVPEP
jgi:hypothetical protein